MLKVLILLMFLNLVYSIKGIGAMFFKFVSIIFSTFVFKHNPA